MNQPVIRKELLIGLLSLWTPFALDSLRFELPHSQSFAKVVVVTGL